MKLWIMEKRGFERCSKAPIASSFSFSFSFSDLELDEESNEVSGARTSAAHLI